MVVDVGGKKNDDNDVDMKETRQGSSKRQEGRRMGAIKITLDGNLIKIEKRRGKGCDTYHPGRQ